IERRNESAYGDREGKDLDRCSYTESPSTKLFVNRTAIILHRRPRLPMAVVIDDVADQEKRDHPIDEIEQRFWFGFDSFKGGAPENIVHLLEAELFQALPNRVVAEKRGRV